MKRIQETFSRSTLCMLFFALCLALPAFASAEEANGESVTVTGRWKKGDTKELTLRYISEKKLADTEAKEGVTTRIAVKVLESTKDGSVIEWKYGKIDVDKGGDQVAKMLFELASGGRVVYKTDAQGALVDIVNWEEVRDFTSASIDKASKASGITQEVKAFLEQTKAAYSTKEGVLASFPEINTYHYVHGAQFPIEGAMEADTQYGNPLGGEPLPAKMFFEMTEYNPKKNHCKIVLVQETDKEAGKQAFLEAVRQDFEKNGQQMPQAGLEGLEMFVAEEYEYDVDLSKGWMKKAAYKKEMVAGPTWSKDAYEITVK